MIKFAYKLKNKMEMATKQKVENLQKRIVGKLYSKSELQYKNGSQFLKFELETVNGTIVQFVLWDNTNLINNIEWDEYVSVIYSQKNKTVGSKTYLTNYCNYITGFQSQIEKNNLFKKTHTDIQINNLYKSFLEKNGNHFINVMQKWYTLLSTKHIMDIPDFMFVKNINFYIEKYGKDRMNDAYITIRDFNFKKPLYINEENLENLFFDLQYRANIFKNNL